jgi:DnaK suppressor protein
MSRTVAQKNQNGHGMYRTMLLEKKRSVLRSLGMKSETLAGLGRVAEEDQAPISHEAFVSSRVNTLEYAGLRLVNEALDRIESGDYGICLACEKPIPPKRLRALPWARYCVNCQEQRNSPDSEPEAEEAARPTLTW